MVVRPSSVPEATRAGPLSAPRHRLRIVGVEVFPDLPENPPDVVDVNIGAADRDEDRFRRSVRIGEVTGHEGEIRIIVILHRPPQALSDRGAGWGTWVFLIMPGISAGSAI